MGLFENTPPRIQIFHPSLEEMKDFSAYISKIEKLGAHKAGLAKIIPPAEWKPRARPYDTEDVYSLVIKAPIRQELHGRQGLYHQYNIQRKSLTVREFKKLAESPKYKTPNHFDFEELERKYWKNVTYNPPIYGADVPGTLYDDDVEEFNMNHLNTILDMVNESYGIKIMGVNTAYLYFGMWKTTFAWHTEDMDLYSINYLHFGAPKSWYAIPPEHGKRLERLASGFFPSSNKACPAFLRHKTTLISPQVLKQYSIPFNKITQEAGEFMITFPYAYHAGYNHGFNCAESTNFACERWVEYGKRARRCVCRADSVKISMEAFIRKFQPERYDLWLQGKDIGPHPEDPSHISAAPPPSDYELTVISNVPAKSRRHPTYKPELDSSYPESYDGDTFTSPVPTKAAKKLFELEPSTSSNDYLHTSPPDLKEAVKKMSNRIRQKEKRKKTRAPMKRSGVTGINTNGPGYCTQPTSTVLPLTWTSSSLPTVDVSQILERFLKDSSEENTGLPRSHLNYANDGRVNVDYLSRSHFSLPSLPSSSTSTSTFTSNSASTNTDNNLANSTLNVDCVGNELEYDQMMSKEMIFDDDQSVAQMVEVSGKRVEACTSTEDLLSNEVILQSKTVHSDDLVKLVYNGSNTDLNEILRCVTIPLYLYQFLPYNFFGEQLYNCSISTIYPHCAVCILLNKFEINPNWIEARLTIPKSSQILIPSTAFAFKVIDSSTNLEEVKFSPLLVCIDCKICVHTNCYGVLDILPGEENNWKCDRCLNKNYGIHCYLCPLRGGALKQTQDENKWAHVTCALMQPGVSIKNGILKGPIDISAIKKNRAHNVTFKCIYCQRSNNRLSDYVSGYCIQCYKAPKCLSKFHVTCAHINGAIFEANDWPDPIRVYCNKCILKDEESKLQNVDKPEQEIEIGTKVIGKSKNNRYYDAIIVDKKYIMLHHVHFNDNSFSRKIRARDFTSHDIEQGNIPEIGDRVTINWDKETLTGKYSGYHTYVSYRLQFEDGSKINAKRENFYLLDEKLPKKVKDKRSLATLMKSDAFFWKQSFSKIESHQKENSHVVIKENEGEEEEQEEEEEEEEEDDDDDDDDEEEGKHLKI